MKTRTSYYKLSWLRRSRRALTILEMLVSTAMLAFIVLGLTAMFIQTQKAFKTGVKQTSVTDAGRAIVDMMASDLSQMQDAQLTNQNAYPPTVNTYFLDPNILWYKALQLNQYENGLVFRTNISEGIFALVQTNNIWTGVGYVVSNWFPGLGTGNLPAGVGTLYRYSLSTNAPLTAYTYFGLLAGFTNAINNDTFTNFHRIADGVVGLKITAFDSDGNESYYEPGYDASANVGSQVLQYPLNVPTPPNSSTFVVKYLPHSLDIEVAVLEPEAVEHARALFQSGAMTSASNYLANAVGQVEVFRQHILIPAAP